MTRMRRISLVLAALICLPALAEFTTVTEAYEVSLGDFRAPASRNGNVTFRACADCEMQTVRVTPVTRYVLSGRDVRLQEFRNAISIMAERETATVVVMHHLETDTVTSVSFSR